MPIDLPPALTMFFQATEADDAATVLTAFADDAVVIDDGRTYRGRDEIRGWAAKDISGLDLTHHVTDVSRDGDGDGSDSDGGGEIVVTVRTSGNFDGSPLTFEYRVQGTDHADGRIARMSIGLRD
ncbi:nuclear transport factor 2 family protein [Actinomadura scrupuli]|uniref:nuclear transport factor 2 family protein n=1 Tax=Actinomadura scrupuli TaxID=559629 RepID=UPI003D98C763